MVEKALTRRPAADRKQGKQPAASRTTEHSKAAHGKTEHGKTEHSKAEHSKAEQSTACRHTGVVAEGGAGVARLFGRGAAPKSCQNWTLVRIV